jgi:hypothetical protein
MRVAVPQGAKLYPIDRNPVNILFEFMAASTGPISPTTVWSYTVPAARAFLQQWAMLRQWVLGPDIIGQFGVVDIRVNGYRAIINSINTDAQGNHRFDNIPTAIIYLAGVQITGVRFITYEAYVQQNVGMIGVEFDR